MEILCQYGKQCINIKFFYVPKKNGRESKYLKLLIDILKRMILLGQIHYVVVCTDDYASLINSNKELTIKGSILKIAPYIFSSFMIGTLVAKEIDQELHNVLQDLVIVINQVSTLNATDSIAAYFQYFRKAWGLSIRLCSFTRISNAFHVSTRTYF